MFWIAVLVITFGLMSLSKKAWGSPLVIFGLIYLGGCVALLLGAVMKMVGISGARCYRDTKRANVPRRSPCVSTVM